MKLTSLFFTASIAAAACSLGDDAGGAAGDCVFGPTCMNMEGDGGPSNSAQIDASSPPGDGMLSDYVDPLCGVGACNPDKRLSCADYGEIAERISSAVVADAGALDGSLDVDGGGADAGLGDAGGQVADAALDATIDSGDDAAWDAASDGSASGPEVSFGCRVAPGSKEIERSCGEIGEGKAGAACVGSSDCDAGLGCVGEPGKARCLPYCCTGADSCAAGSFCAPRPIREKDLELAEAPLVPVCVPADNCKLDETFPCTDPQAQGCVCDPSTSCTVVRDDGTTSCAEPGEGKVGEACPCAHDHFCSQATGTCLRICDVRDTTSNPCGTGKCQTALVFPDGFGVCVGGPTPTANR